MKATQGRNVGSKTEGYMRKKKEGREMKETRGRK